MTSHPSPDGISERVDALEVLAKAATPGPWTLCIGHYTDRATEDCGCHGGGYSLGQTHQQDTDVQIYSPPGTYVKRDHRCYDNAAFIAACSPDFILALCTLVRGASEDRAAKVTRFEVIDHRSGAEARGREFTAFGCRVSLSYQDDGRTLKAFVDDAARTPNQDSPNGR